jgi:hypothetical protein
LAAERGGRCSATSRPLHRNLPICGNTKEEQVNGCGTETSPRTAQACFGGIGGGCGTLLGLEAPASRRSSSNLVRIREVPQTCTAAAVKGGNGEWGRRAQTPAHTTSAPVYKWNYLLALNDTCTHSNNNYVLLLFLCPCPSLPLTWACPLSASPVDFLLLCILHPTTHIPHTIPPPPPPTTIMYPPPQPRAPPALPRHVLTHDNGGSDR